MAERLTKQSFTVTRLNLDEINDAFHRIQLELDRMAGLSGTITLYSSVQYADSNGQIIHGWGAKP